MPNSSCSGGGEGSTAAAQAPSSSSQRARAVVCSGVGSAPELSRRSAKDPTWHTALGSAWVALPASCAQLAVLRRMLTESVGEQCAQCYLKLIYNILEIIFSQDNNLSFNNLKLHIDYLKSPSIHGAAGFSLEHVAPARPSSCCRPLAPSHPPPCSFTGWPLNEPWRFRCVASGRRTTCRLHCHRLELPPAPLVHPAASLSAARRALACGRYLSIAETEKGALTTNPALPRAPVAHVTPGHCSRRARRAPADG